MLPEPLAITLKVTTVLEKLNVKYVIGGSLASTLYGMVRTTQDSDIVAQMQAEHIQPFVQALEPEFFIDEQMISDSVRNQGSFNIIHRQSMFKVDVFIPPARPFVESQFARARRQNLTDDPAVSVSFASAEDTVLSKLEWYRLGGEVSELPSSAPHGAEVRNGGSKPPCAMEDALGVLKLQAGQLDQAYLLQWARELKVADLLERASKES
jgi:hypothetical protein